MRSNWFLRFYTIAENAPKRDMETFLFLVCTLGDSLICELALALFHARCICLVMASFPFFLLCALGRALFFQGNSVVFVFGSRENFFGHVREG